MALLVASPALAQSGKIKWANPNSFATEPLLSIHPSGRIEICLDRITSLHVTKGGVGVDISAKEVFDALSR